MKCPFCKEKETSVLDSRPTEDGGVIRRRRICGCERKERFTTFERVQFREFLVVKKMVKNLFLIEIKLLNQLIWHLEKDLLI